MIKKDFTFSVRDIAEMGILCALAIVLDTFVKVPLGLTGGGSINIAMIPLFFIALHQGWFKGFIAGAIIFGVTTCLIDGYGFTSYPFDYFFAFGSVAVIGVMNKLIVSEQLGFKNYLFYFLGITAVMAIRFVSSTISGVIVWETPFVDSMAYQATYIVPTYIALLIICIPALDFFVSIMKRLSK